MMAEYTLDTSLSKETVASLDPFTLAYIEALFWLLTDDDGHSLDYLGLHDLSAEALSAIRDDCAGFQRTAAGLLEGSDSRQAGHDYWLTRNHHGAGYWDRDASVYPNDPQGKGLTRLAHAEGESNAYVGDDGKVYI